MPDRGHAVVTGGSSSLGQSVASLLAARGYRVSLIARNAEQLECAAAAIPGQVIWAAVDVTKRVELDHAVRSLVERSGPGDILVAAAGGARPGYFLQLDDDVFRAHGSWAGLLSPILQRNADRTVSAVRAERTPIAREG